MVQSAYWFAGFSGSRGGTNKRIGLYHLFNILYAYQIILSQVVGGKFFLIVYNRKSLIIEETHTINTIKSTKLRQWRLNGTF